MRFKPRFRHSHSPHLLFKALVLFSVPGDPQVGTLQSNFDSSQNQQDFAITGPSHQTQVLSCPPCSGLALTTITEATHSEPQQIFCSLMAPFVFGEGKSCRQRACKLTLGTWDSMVLWCWPQDTLSHPQNCIPQRANFTEHKERQIDRYHDGGKIQIGMQMVTSKSVLQTNDITTFKWMEKIRSGLKFEPS